ncbi:MAG: LacI family DNA-binding transcriptional regulator [Gammaproteobacteria bacterium]|nr:LacI family DNA-binding transcriptional regulator [Gammaproteobacteria bacterium]MDE0285663.1 LacI family DNA-binding transcriptional regulator [Gammaproteobacteria bacterium]MDE0511126.1 LacI family DNA-binding transcriptional regulator [Gammaproteobacteria bacterium]
MKDVAEQARVSVSTVSYVLNNNGQVSAERRARVLNAVRALDYIPNESARSLKRQSASTIGLVVPDLMNEFFSRLARGVVQAAAMHDMLVVLCSAENSEEAEFGNARLLRSRRVDGVIYESGFHESPRSLLELQSLGPVVLVDERIPGLDLPAVVADGRRGSRDVAAHVIKLGHRRIACIAGPTTHWTAEQRLSGYREGLALGGIDPDEMSVLVGDYEMNSGYELARVFLDVPEPQRPTAVLCANDLMAIGALEYCRANAIDVPGDVSIVGFDDIPTVQLLTPRLTTVRQPAHEMGMRAAELLISMVQGRENPDLLRPHPVELVVRESTSKPK